MSTPYMAFSCLVRNAIAVFWALWLATFVIVRVYALHEAYVAEVGRRSDERWLLDRCQDPEFYANLRQHSNLCTEVGTLRVPCQLFYDAFSCPLSYSLKRHLQVSNNARANLLLKALSRVAADQVRLPSSAQAEKPLIFGCAAGHQSVRQDHVPGARLKTP